MAAPTSDQVHAKAVKAHAALEDLITEVAGHADPAQAKQLTAPLKQCSSIVQKVVEVSGKTQEAPTRPTIGSATDEMMAEKTNNTPETPAENAQDPAQEA